MKILVIGSGGREHALCWKIAQSPLCGKLYCIPGNAGIARNWECPAVNGGDFEAVIDFVKSAGVDFTIVGPEQPLVEGIVDRFNAEGLKVFGPTAKAAMIEGDKAFAKSLMAETGVPTAEFTAHTDVASALKSPVMSRFPVVIKASGLAAGKGVIVAESRAEAVKTLRDIIENRKFGEAGATVVIEEYLEGEELSCFFITGGNNVIALPPSQDHKQIGEGDTGLNTGGMGAYSPPPVATAELLSEVERRIARPILEAMRDKDRIYQGMLYCGLIITDDGPKVLEFNCRFGDPETQCVLPLIQGDLLEMMLASTEEEGVRHYLKDHPGLEVYSGQRHAACVITASGGYPGSYAKGYLITGLERDYEDTIVFHAGTRIDGNDVVTSGGRVLGVTGLGDSLKAALERAYGAIDGINFKDMYFRRDIGWRALGR